jgi:hypothetical protein
MRKIQKEVGRWISGRQIVEGYNAQQKLERGMTEPEDTAQKKNMTRQKKHNDGKERSEKEKRR